MKSQNEHVCARARATAFAVAMLALALPLVNASDAEAQQATSKESTGETSSCWPAPPTNNQHASLDAYWLGSGDRVRVSVYQRPEISGDFQVREDGRLSLPLIGSIPAAGRSVADLEQTISETLQGISGRAVSTSVEVVERRPFFVVGHINRPGAYPFVPGATVLHAIAMGGGQFRTPISGGDTINITREIARLGLENEERKQNMARLARLKAEREGAITLEAPEQLLRIETEDRATELITAEERVLEQRRALLNKEVTARNAAIDLAVEEITAMEEQLDRIQAQSKLARSELATSRDLVNRGLGRRSDLFTMQRIVAGLEADERELVARIARAKANHVTAERDRHLVEITSKLQVEQEINTVEGALAGNDLAVRFSKRIIEDLTGAPVDTGSSDVYAPLTYQIVRRTQLGYSLLEASELTALCPGDVVKVTPDLAQ